MKPKNHIAFNPLSARWVDINSWKQWFLGT